MVDHVELLPPASTPWARAVAEANDPFAGLYGPFTDVLTSQRVLQPQFLPFVIWELGLGELSPYVPSLYQLVEEGPRWNRIRGTPASIRKGLSWIGYDGAVREAAVRRRAWSKFDVHLSRIRDSELPDLDRISGIVSLAAPARSRFWRGYAGLDVQPAETSYRKTSGSTVGDDSGTYIPSNTTKWSFGREWQATATLGQAELTALNAWPGDKPAGDLWSGDTFRWSTATYLWAFPQLDAWKAAIAEALSSSGATWVRFRDAGGHIIGDRRAVLRRVSFTRQGEYPFGSSSLSQSAGSFDGILVAARTDFGDGAGHTAASMSVVFGGSVPAGQKPGVRWLPMGAQGGQEGASSSVNIPFGLTVRERPMILLLF